MKCEWYNRIIMPPVESGNQEIKTLLEENIAVTKENNRLLREMRRNAILGLIAKVVIWLVILGVPLFFLSTYLGQLPAGLFGVPNEEQVQQILDLYRTEYQ
jgi:hypothetical protein